MRALALFVLGCFAGILILTVPDATGWRHS